ncbi:GFA family protein [Kaarinaea lacus]
MTGEIINGSCLCGKVRYEFINEHRVFQYCHCSRCRKFTGSSHASNIIVDPEKFTWKAGEEHIGRYEHPDAKHFATTFCKVCGSSLPWLTQSWKAVVIPAGTLDDDPKIRPQHNVFYASRADWYVEPDSLAQYDELPTK